MTAATGHPGAKGCQRTGRCWLIGLAWLTCSAGFAQSPDYVKHIKPLFQQRCYACHGALKQEAGLRLDTVASMRAGGDSGPAIVPGDASASLVVKALRGGEDASKMPPPGEAVPLTEEQIERIAAWIQAGAHSPDNEQPDADPRDHWAFRRPLRPTPPSTKYPAANPIDSFIAAAWEKHDLRPSEPAAPDVLLRRVYLDLTGLPPSREALHAFLADPSDDAYLQVVNGLLDSPHYGERWARHWMDVWRYADWYGRRNVPDWWNSACQIWRWRDWIVASLNADRGYDVMIQEMLAGDELAGDQPERAVATGFLARNWYALNYNAWMRDNIEHTAKAFLGLTLNCAHCHDHKYDPITHEDYFRFRAFFEPIEMRQDRWPGEPDPGPFQKYEYGVLRKVVPYGAIRVFDDRLDAPTYIYTGGDERNKRIDRGSIAPGVPAFLDDGAFRIDPVALPPRAFYPGLQPFLRDAELDAARQAIVAAESNLASQRALVEPEVARFAEPLARAEQDDRALETQIGSDVASAALAVSEAQWKAIQRRRDEALRPLTAAEKELIAAQRRAASLQARIAADDARYLGGPGNVDELSLFAARAERIALHAAAEAQLAQAETQLAAARTAGAADGIAKAEQQVAAARTALENAAANLVKTDATYSPLSPVYPSKSSGRRSALARWIASKKNPLTARVAVNHLWLRHFGQPLVASVFDFGRNGAPPTHPELLDWLAVEFMESGWSQKHLHRLIVTSRMYRQSSATNSPATAHNKHLDPDNRFYWRYPARRLEAEAIRDSLLSVAGVLDRALGGKELEVDQDGKTFRRSLYYSSHPEDGGRLALLENFDVPDTCDCYRRSESILPQQALALTNSPLARNLSRTLSQRLWHETQATPPLTSDRRQLLIRAAFEQILSRTPNAEELSVSEQFWAELAPALASTGLEPLTAETSAFESLIHALLNHHELVTIR